MSPKVVNQLLEDLPFSVEDVSDEAKELKALNEKLWVIEDKIREKESQQAFDSEFVRTTRSERPWKVADSGPCSSAPR